LIRVTRKIRLQFAPAARDTLKDLEAQAQYEKKLRKVRKALGLLQRDPRYPGLNSHKYVSLHGANGEDVWDSYVENNSPAAWRIFWHYGPDEDVITILVIGPHP
jgi:hypothetical protein